MHMPCSEAGRIVLVLDSDPPALRNKVWVLSLSLLVSEFHYMWSCNVVGELLYFMMLEFTVKKIELVS